MKKIIKILILAFLSLLVFSNVEVSVAENIKGLGTNQKKITRSNNSIGESTKDVGFKIINTVRIVFSGILVVFMVYVGIQMITSMGSNEEDLTKAKKSILYALVGIVFINFPIAIYNAIVGTKSGSTNLFIYERSFINVVTAIINFLEILLAGIAIFIIVITGIKLITSRGREEKITEAKNKIVWVVIALIFIGFIEAYKRLIIAEGGINMSQATDIFSNLANLLLYIAGPIAIFFITLAGFYYITSSGDEERAKKGKSIVVNTLIGLIILFCSYILLNDLSLLIF